MRVNLTQAQTLSGEQQFAAYACLDTTGTREIFDVLHPRLSPEQRRVYDWSVAQQAPAVAMGLRGIRIDRKAHAKVLAEVAEEVDRCAAAIRAHPLLARWQELEPVKGACPSRPVVGKDGKPKLVLDKKAKKYVAKFGLHRWPRAKKGEPALPIEQVVCKDCGSARLRPMQFEPSSSAQVGKFFYEVLQVPKQYDKKGVLSTGADCLDKIANNGMAHLPPEEQTKFKKKAKLVGLPELCALFKAYKKVAKQHGFLKFRQTLSGRFTSTFNVCGAWTGRWSSRKNPWREGGNAQNITEKHRHILIPDPGYKMGYADLKTAESLVVAYSAGDEKYIEAHKGDVHTFVTREVWPDVAKWTGNIKEDKKIASSIFPDWDPEPGHDYRFQSKRVQHGSNYGLTPFGMALIAHISVNQAQRNQTAYFDAFPDIPEWQRWITKRCHDQLPIYNPLDRPALMAGRPRDPHTRKQALAYGPQSAVGDILNTGLWRIWNECDPHLIQLLAQVHDAVLFQYRPEREKEVFEAIATLMYVPVVVKDIKGVEREMAIPVELAVGFNWGKKGKNEGDNPRGLEEVKLAS